MSKKVIATAFLIITTFAQPVSAEKSESTTTAFDLKELNAWAETLTKDLLTQCDKTTQKKWLAHYSELESKLIDRTVKYTDTIWKQIPSTSTFRDFFEVVFPQDLPKNYPMRGAFSSCFEYFEAYQNAHTPQAVKAIEECYQDRYKKNPPAILDQYLSCLKAMKSNE